MPSFTQAKYKQTQNPVSAGEVAPTEILRKTRCDTLPEEHDVEVVCTTVPSQALNTKIRAFEISKKIPKGNSAATLSSLKKNLLSLKS